MNKSLFIFFKIIFLLFNGIYILTLPLLTLRFGLVDGLNPYGYINPSIVLILECAFCIASSFVSFIWCGLMIKKLRENMREKTQ
jgi:hypothetical protein